ncbi:MAG: hypothetical protein ISS18_16240 [Bacteroidales bacterium]|nr:hypothetical protein [Bacteroidales bacterium]
MDIETKFVSIVQRIIFLEAEDEALRIILYLKDGTNLRVAEKWNQDILEKYSYYWLSSKNELIIGWDNAPHHTKIDTFPHHRHVGNQKNMQPSNETCLEEVINFILNYGK